MNFSHTARQSGFNLLELMITLLIGGMVLGFGIPSFSQFIKSNRMAAAANDLVTSIHAARTEAVKRRQTVTICASSNWSDANPDCDLGGGAAGWIVFFDANSDVSVNGGDTVIIAHAPLAEGITFAIDPASVPYVQYGGNGFPRTAGAGTPDFQHAALRRPRRRGHRWRRSRRPLDPDRRHGPPAAVPDAGRRPGRNQPDRRLLRHRNS